MSKHPMSLRFTPILALGAVLVIAVGTPRGSRFLSPEVPERGTRWAARIGEVERALGRRHLAAAEVAWHDAYGEALASRRSEAMVAVGDAYLRIGEAARSPAAARPKARQAYLAAFFRARHQGSVKGVLRVAEAFAALGDREVVELCLAAAETLAAQKGDVEATGRVRAFRERLVPRVGDGYAAPNAF